MDQLLAGARRQAVGDADTVFTAEAPSVGRWGFEPALLTELRMPVLSVLGERSDDVSSVSREAHELLLKHSPHAEAYVLPRATHLLQWQNPADLAAALTGCIRHHPVGRWASRIQSRIRPTRQANEL